MNAKKDHYGTLGVPENAEIAKIKKAYRNIVAACHPDTHPDDEEAARRFREATEAYHTLSNPVTRTAYDRQGRPIPVASIPDLFEHDPDGTATSAEMTIHGLREARGGTAEVLSVSVPAAILQAGGHVILPAHAGERFAGQALAIPPGAHILCFGFLPGRGASGTNGGNAGDLFIILSPETQDNV